MYTSKAKTPKVYLKKFFEQRPKNNAWISTEKFAQLVKSIKSTPFTGDTKYKFLSYSSRYGKLRRTKCVLRISNYNSTIPEYGVAIHTLYIILKTQSWYFKVPKVTQQR